MCVFVSAVYFAWNNKNESNDLSRCKIPKKEESGPNNGTNRWGDECIFEINGRKYVPSITIAVDPAKNDFNSFEEFEQFIDNWVTSRGGYIASSYKPLHWVTVIFPEPSIEELQKIELEAEKLRGVDWATIGDIVEVKTL